MHPMTYDNIVHSQGDHVPPRKAIPRQTKLDVLMEAGYRCGNPACGTILTLDIHHIEWVEDGGGNDASNLLPLCPNCHALHTRGEIPREAVKHWKRMLTALNHSFDRHAMDLLLFLRSGDWSGVYYTSDGVAKFAGLIVAGLVDAKRHPITPREVLRGHAYDALLNSAADIAKARDEMVKLMEETPYQVIVDGVWDLLVMRISDHSDQLMRDLGHCQKERDELEASADWYRPLLFRLCLSERGYLLVDAWRSGDEAAYVRLLNDNSSSGDGQGDK